MIFGFFIFFVAIIISAVAEYYSIMGLTAIFAAAYWPVVVMGVALGVGKITAAIWLKIYWEQAKWTYKVYLVPAIVFLMFLTSMGIFGFLSKAHSDLSLQTSNITAQVAIYDDKIKIANDNIEANRGALKQLDASVDQILGRSTTEQGALRSVKIRNSQQKERKQLINDIAAEQELVAKLNEEKSKISAQVRKVEAEVGPIKYIAALIYGNNPSTELLESAVRWVIILIVLVFDPLALCLMLAAQQSIRWGREERKQQKLLEAKLAAEQAEQAEQKRLSEERAKAEAENQKELSASIVNEPQDIDKSSDQKENDELNEPKYAPDDGPLTNEQYEQIKEDVLIERFFARGRQIAKAIDQGEYVPLFANIDLSNINFNPNNENSLLPPILPVDLLQIPIKDTSNVIVADVEYSTSHNETDQSNLIEQPSDINNLELPSEPVVKTEVIAPVIAAPIPTKFMVQQQPEAVAPKAKEKIQVPETLDRSNQQATEFKPVADNIESPVGVSVKAHFGITFPPDPEKGELFLRVDYLPTRLFKFNGSKWIEVDKSLTDSYVYDTEYIKFMIKEIDAGRLDLDDLSTSERDQIAEFLANDEQNSNTP